MKMMILRDNRPKRFNDEMTKWDFRLKRLIDQTTKFSFNRLITLSFVLALIFVGCGSNPTVAGGSGTETTNGIVMLSSNKPAVNARVTIRNRDKTLQGNDSAITTMTDKNGYFSVNHDTIARELIIVTTDNEAISLFEENLTDTTVLSPYCTFSGTVAGQSSGTLFLAGIDTRATVSGGAFRFEKVPAGWYPVIYSDGASRFLCGAVNLKSNLDSSIIVPPSGVLIANFSDGFDRNPLTELLGGTEWKSFSSKEQRIYRDGSWQFELFNDKNDTTTITPLIEKGALTVTTSPLNHGGKYAGVRLKLLGADLSSMTALKFRARGNGSVRINLEAGVLNGTMDQYGVLIPLTGGWQEFTIPVADLHLIDPILEKKHPWNSVRSKIQRIECVFHGNHNLSAVGPLTLEIDDVMLEGCTLDQL